MLEVEADSMQGRLSHQNDFERFRTLVADMPDEAWPVVWINQDSLRLRILSSIEVSR